MPSVAIHATNGRKVVASLPSEIRKIATAINNENLPVHPLGIGGHEIGYRAGNVGGFA
jgi:hypothetical protein